MAIQDLHSILSNLAVDCGTQGRAIWALTRPF
jgi:hypothetical protein